MRYTTLVTLTIATFLMLMLPVKSSALAIPALSTVAVVSTSNCTSSKACAQQGTENLDAGSTLSIQKVIGTVISILAWIIGTISVIMVIFGGFKYVTSGGDPNAISSARSTILYALIGLVIALLAQVLIHFVLFKLFPKFK